MKRFFTKLLTIFILTGSFFVAPRVGAITACAPVGLCFGGVVTAVFPCDTGLLAYIAEPLPAGVGATVLPYMWIWGVLPFANYIPPHPGQFMIGYATGFMVCFVGIVPIGGGFIITGHGGSF